MTYIPFDIGRAINRPDLNKQMQDALAKKVTIITAMPGTGKSWAVRTAIAVRTAKAYFCYIAAGNCIRQQLTEQILENIVMHKTDPASADKLKNAILSDERETFLLEWLSREAGRQLPQDEVFLVIDDFQNAQGDRGVLEFIERLVLLAPRQFHFVIVSDKEVLPFKYASPIWQDIKLLGQNDFLLSREEVETFLIDQNWGLLKCDRDLIWEITGGWMIALVDVCREMDRNNKFFERLKHKPLLFIRLVPDLNDYIENRILIKLPKPQQQFLENNCIETVIHMNFSAEAAEYYPIELITQIMEGNLPLSNIDMAKQNFRLNPTFQSFLYNRMLKQEGEEGLILRHKKAASYCFQKENWVDCFYHAIYSEDIQLAAKCFRYLLFEDIDYYLLKEYRRMMKAIPGELLENDPWIQMGYARAIQNQYPLIALQYLNQAIQCFQNENITEGIILAACQKISISFFSAGNTNLKKTVVNYEYINHLKTADPVLNAYREVFQVYFRLQSDTDEDDLLTMLEEAEQVAIMQENNNLWLWACFVTILYCEKLNRRKLLHVKVLQAIEAIERPKIEKTLKMYICQTIGSVYFTTGGEYEKAHQWYQKSREIAEEIEATAYYVFLNLCDAYTLNCLGQVGTAATAIQETEAKSKNILSPKNEYLWAYFYISKGFNKYAGGESESALLAAAEALDYSRKADRKTYIIRSLYLFGSALREQGRYEESIEALEEGLAISLEKGAFFYIASNYYHLALTYHAMGDLSKFQLMLGKALKLGSEHSFYHFNFTRPWELPQILKEFKGEITPIYLETLLQKNDKTAELTVPAGRFSNKEFRFSLMGSFKIERRTEGGKSCKSSKAIYLLKMLAISKVPLSIYEILEELWPGWDEKSSMNNFYFTLHQLRAHLGNKQTVIFRRGLCYLDSDCYSTDIQEFDHLVAEARVMADYNDIAGCESMYRKAIGLYRGKFLDGDQLEGFIASEREELERKVYNVLIDYGSLLMERNEYIRAIEVLCQTVKNNFYDEDACRLMMLAQYLYGRKRQALELYRKLENRLADEVGAEPHWLTRELYQKIRSGESFDRSSIRRYGRN